jgi:protein-S-isoprenylcysteine O-methyltransferase Ste14
MAFLLGSAVIEATLYSQGAGILTIPFAPWIGLTLMFISSIVLLLVVVNLALKGLGAPLAFSLTRKVATEWFYAWTRNPIAITAFIFLIGIGIFLQSGIFLVWVMLIVMPCFILFVKVYEERELEIRFGQSYLDYKARTPGFIPRKPQ